MTEAEFNAADRSGSGVAPPEIIADNNPAPGMVAENAGITMDLSNQGKIYLWDGIDTAVYLRLDRTINEGTPSEVKLWSLVECTQDATEFAALLND